MKLPTGPAVTFLFTDIEGSTRLERSVGTATWAGVVADHDRRLRGAIESAGGVVVKTEGDAFFAAFPESDQAIEAIVTAQRAIAAGPWPEGVEMRIRAGLHRGEGRLRERRADDDAADYVGIDVNYTARIAAAANGGQVLLSDALATAVRPSTNGDRFGSGVSIVDEGLRIVKDFDDPMRLHRLVVSGAAEDTRPLRTLEAPSNLPHEATSLVGRETEIDDVATLLLDGRIITLAGPGGTGKTRLAIGVAEFVRRRFPHGVWFVDLAAVQDPELLGSAIALAVGLSGTSGQTTDEALGIYLRDRSILLVLDNLEQLLPDAATRVATLVRAAPGLRVLVTSRELLRISGERGHLVPPLDLDAGVRLFEDRARALRPDLVVTSESLVAIRAISERLGGLPLAIELAAARIRLFSPPAILERLGRTLDLGSVARDLPERQRTLRAAIDWSHDLLAEGEQEVFRRLAVFAGGWTGETAAVIVDPENDLGLDLLAGLESLVDKSLVRVEAAEGAGDEPRFSMHPLLREYAFERLEASGERADLESRHARAFVPIAEETGREILGPRSDEALRRLDREKHNLRAAIDWSVRTGDLSPGLRILAATWRWFQQRGGLREARGVLADLLDRPASHSDVRLRIAALSADGGLAYWTEDYVGARARYDERLRLAESLDDPALLADAHYDIAFLYMVSQDPVRLREHAQQALDLYSGLGDTASATRANQALVLVEFLEGDYAAARDREEEILAEFRRAGAQYQLADSSTLQSAIYAQLGDVETAWQRMIEGLRIFSTRDMASGLARSLGMAAHIQLRFGDPEFGARIGGATLEFGRAKGVAIAPTKVLHMKDPELLAAEMLGAARAAELLAAGAVWDLHEVIEAVLAAPNPSN